MVVSLVRTTTTPAKPQPNLQEHTLLTTLQEKHSDYPHHSLTETMFLISKGTCLGYLYAIRGLPPVGVMHI